MKHLTVLLFIALGCAMRAEAQDVVGKVFSLQGSAQVVRSGSTVSLSDGAEVHTGDEVQVGDPGRVALELTDGSYIRLPAGAKMRFPAKSGSLDLLDGSLHFFSHSEQHPNVVTEHVTAAIRGTEFVVKTDAQSSSISMFSGSVDGASDHGRVSLAKGQGARFEKGRAPSVYTLMSSERSVQWSMFVPFIGGDTEIKASPVAAKGLELFLANQASAALRALPSNAAPCSAEAVLRARILVSSGDPDRGAKLLEECVVAKQRGSLHSLAEASLAMLRLQQGDRVAAENLSRHAIEEDPGSVASRMARSFVLQDRGDLDGALAAVTSDPPLHDYNLRSREAEVLFMFGKVPEARAILETIPDKSWYSEAVYGFVLMGDRSFDEAKVAFERSIKQQPGAALPQMGLGIVSFNKGELAQARQSFEKAAVLEPSRSIYRSYLGKDYFEDDNYAPAYPEYARAMELDPNDPTPYLYRSFMKVADNNLIGALDDINTARELSDRRDVYRSSFLLDEDSAMQSASIGRVYNELGYRERGRVEAITALIDDYQNASAHRLLSQTQEDFYLADVIASERRMANLFSPLSINVVDSIGTGVSLNEYSQLLEKDGWRTAVNNFYDSKAETFRTGVLSAHKFGNYVLGLSADGLGQDGIADDPRTGVGTFGWSFQAQPDWGNRFLFDGRGISSGQTDYTDSADVLEGNLSAAWLHRFSPNDTLLLNSTYERSRSKIHTPSNPDNELTFRTFDITEVYNGEVINNQLFVPADSRENYYQTSVVNEAQYISETESLTHIVTYRNVANDLSDSDQTTLPFEFADGSSIDIPFESSAQQRLSGNYAQYLGDYEVTDGLHIHFGGEYDSVEFAQDTEDPPYISNTLSQTLWSPKGGIVYNPDESIIFRTGYAEQLAKGTKFDLVSIAPTTVGGIIQRFNDLPGTKAQTFGVGLDLHPRKTTYFGGEWTRRWLTTLSQDTEYAATINYDTGVIGDFTDLAAAPSNTYSDQNFLTAYVYEIIGDSLATGLDYRFAEEDIQDDQGANSRDHRGKAFGRYYVDKAWFFQGASVYRYQNFQGSSSTESGIDAGWFFNAGLGYRLPTRHGLLLLDVQNIFGQQFAANQATYFNEPIFSNPTVQLVANFNF